MHNQQTEKRGYSRHEVEEFVDENKQQAERSQFANIIGQRERTKIDSTGIQYRLPVPGGKIESGKRLTNVALRALNN